MDSLLRSNADACASLGADVPPACEPGLTFTDHEPGFLADCAARFSPAGPADLGATVRLMVRLGGYRDRKRDSGPARLARGAWRRTDFRPVMVGEICGPLQDRSLFEKVKLDPEGHALVWPNGADFDPAALRDWPIHEEDFRDRAGQQDAIRPFGCRF